MSIKPIAICAFLLIASTTTCTVMAQDQPAEHDADELAKKLSNPVASLISAPLQYNYDDGYANGGYKNTVNVQPVVPISLNADWNLISRTILPVAYQNDVRPGTDQAGLGDTVQSFFFSPAKPTSSGLIWGLGPAALVPTGTDQLGAHTWAAGVTGVMLKQAGPWTYGALFNHLMDVGGSGRQDISSTFLQPFLTWGGLGQGQTIGMNTESTYDWVHHQWTIPINVFYSKVSKWGPSWGNQLVSYQAGVRGYAESPRGGPDWGVRLGLTFLFPK